VIDDSLLSWLRYEDDIHAIFSSRSSAREFLSSLKQSAAGAFKIVCDSVHSVGSEAYDFLDLLVDPLSPQFHIIALQCKPVVPLCPTSAHVFAIHKSWPNAVARRVAALSGSHAHSSLCHLYDRYSRANAHEYTLRVLHSAMQQGDTIITKRARSVQPLRVYTFVMRYHPAIKKVLKAALSYAAPPPPDLGFEIRVAWRNALPSTNGLLAQQCSQLLRVGRS
jgi:hypothetical protein